MAGKRPLPVLQQAAEELEEPVEQRLGVEQPPLRALRLEAVHPPLEPKTLQPAVDSGQAVGAACS